MTAESWTVRVSGLPTDVEEDRLTDKLYLHFLRGKHGGGEITSVNITKAIPASALITFEDSEVALSVAQYGKHVLLMDDKKYELAVSFPSKAVDGDKVFLSMRVTVDYTRLPLGKEAVTSLQQSCPDVHCSFNTLKGFCTLKGRYLAVQAMVTQLLSLLEGHTSTDTYLSERSSACGLLDHPINTKRQIETTVSRQASALDLGSWFSPENPSFSQRFEGSGELASLNDPLLEEHSLIMDADTFRYLRWHRGEDYQRILDRYGVEAVDMTVQDITTLFLWAKVGGVGRGVRQVHRNLIRLYEETEAQLCKEKLPKDCGPKEGLQQALEVLRLQLPHVLLSEEDVHVSIVGSHGDVLEAKWFLLDLREQEGHQRPGRAGHNLTAKTSCNARRSERGREYILSARFREAKSKDPRWDMLGIGPGNALTPSNAFKKHPSTPEQKILGDRRELGQTGEDILFKKFGPLPAASEESCTFLSSALIGTGLPDENLQVRSSQSTMHYTDLFGDSRVPTNAVPHSESSFQTALRRTNSFSSFVRLKQNGKGGDTGGTGGKLNRVNSISPGNSREQQDPYSVEVQAPAGMWQYMKDAYCAQLGGMTSGLQMKESQSESSVTIFLGGADPCRVYTCQQELNKLVAMVATDFLVQELPLAMLGVAKPKDETLEMCCAEVRRRFQKVKIQQRRESLVVVGPKQLCTQVVGVLVEVFCDGADRRKGWGGISDTGFTTQTQTLPPQPKSHTVLKGSIDQSNSPLDCLQKECGIQRGGDMGSGTSKQKQNIQQIDSSQRLRQDSRGRGEQVSQSAAQKEPVARQITGKDEPRENKLCRTDQAMTNQAESTRRVLVPACSGPLSLPALGNGTQKVATYKKESDQKPRNTKGLTQRMTQRPLLGPEHPESPEGEETAHQHLNRSDHALEANLTTGIRGTMTFTKLPLCLTGHSKEMTLKITYNIPDGIQGDGHLAPGSPFQGGVFEAYVPLNPQTRRLLPRLKRAFFEGLAFTVTAGDGACRVVWGSVPHKTSVDGGKSGNGYPDPGYIRHLTEVLESLGIEESTALAQTPCSAKS